MARDLDASTKHIEVSSPKPSYYFCRSEQPSGPLLPQRFDSSLASFVDKYMSLNCVEKLADGKWICRCPDWQYFGHCPDAAVALELDGKIDCRALLREVPSNNRGGRFSLSRQVVPLRLRRVGRSRAVLAPAPSAREQLAVRTNRPASSSLAPRSPRSSNPGSFFTPVGTLSSNPLDIIMFAQLPAHACFAACSQTRSSVISARRSSRWRGRHLKYPLVG